MSYDAEGCSISQAAASVMTDLVIGQPVDEAFAAHEAFLELMQGRGQVEPDEEVLEDGIAFAGVAKFPARIKCALLVMDGVQGRHRTGRHQGGSMTDPDHSDLPEVPRPPAAPPPRRPPRTTSSRR